MYFTQSQNGLGEKRKKEKGTRNKNTTRHHHAPTQPTNQPTNYKERSKMKKRMKETQKQKKNSSFFFFASVLFYLDLYSFAVIKQVERRTMRGRKIVV